MIKTADISKLKTSAQEEKRKALEFESNEVVTKARTVFGYKYEPPSKVRNLPLLEVLERLEIDPLDESAVRKYKERKVRQNTREPEMSNSQVLQFACCLFAIGTILNVVCGWSLGPKGRIDWGHMCFLSAFEFLLAYFVAIVASVAIEGRFMERRSAEWVGESLRGYSNFVPEFVLNKALQIKEACPDATLVVQELKIRSAKVVRDPDPFLVVSLGRESYHIEVWDERDFEV